MLPRGLRPLAYCAALVLGESFGGKACGSYAGISAEIGGRRQKRWLGTFLGGAWSSAAATCYAHAGWVRRGCLTRAGVMARSVSISSAAIPTVSISAEPGSLSRPTGREISSAARGRLVFTSTTVQMPNNE